MKKDSKSIFNLGTIVGILALLSGIYLLYSGDTLIGISGSITGIFVAYLSYGGAENKNSKE